MKKKQLFAVISSFVLGCGINATAEEFLATLTPDFSQNIINISGTASRDTDMTVMVLSDGIAPSTLWDSILPEYKNETTAKGVLPNGETLTLPSVSADSSGMLFFVRDFKSGNDGSFEINAGIKESGTYDVYIFADDNVHEYKGIVFSSSADYGKKIAELNEKIESSDKAGFVDLFTEENLEILGFNTEILNDADVKKSAEIFYDSLDGNKLSADNFEENLKFFECSAAIGILNEGKNVNVAEYIKYAIKDDKTAKGYFEAYIKDEDDEKYLLSKMKEKNIDTVEELAEETKSALILAVVKNPNGNANIKDVFSDYKDILGLESVSSKLNVYSSLAGKDFDGIDDLVDEYKDLVKAGSQASESSGGSSSSKKGGSTTVVSTVEQAPAEVLNKDIFDDLDTVPWARKAIVELAAKGVIAGKTKNQFCPDDFITREEFTKLVVAAFASEADEASITFSDVTPGRWSYPYIAKAKSIGLINGYSDTYFGAADLISRQDMSVIIYNTAKYKNIDMGKAENSLSFADDGFIADYAKEAVYTLKDMGIINGIDSVTFAPAENATRAQAAVIIHALLQK